KLDGLQEADDILKSFLSLPHANNVRQLSVVNCQLSLSSLIDVIKDLAIIKHVLHIFTVTGNTRTAGAALSDSFFRAFPPLGPPDHPWRHCSVTEIKRATRDRVIKSEASDDSDNESVRSTVLN